MNVILCRMADDQQVNLDQIDHYDFINAPQFVDFDDLASHDDPQADKFFGIKL